MFENNYPLFNPGRILKTKMLEELRDYPREFIDIKYKIINHIFNLNDIMYQRCKYGQRDSDGPR